MQYHVQEIMNVFIVYYMGEVNLCMSVDKDGAGNLSNMSSGMLMEDHLLIFGFRIFIRKLRRGKSSPQIPKWGAYHKREEVWTKFTSNVLLKKCRMNSVHSRKCWNDQLSIGLCGVGQQITFCHSATVHQRLKPELRAARQP